MKSTYGSRSQVKIPFALIWKGLNGKYKRQEANDARELHLKHVFTFIWLSFSDNDFDNRPNDSCTIDPIQRAQTSNKNRFISL